MAPDFDILIIGGGMVGASLALALKGSSLRIGIIEAVSVDASEQPSYDRRAIALAQGSKRIFTAMDVWEAIESLGVSPIRRIHVSDRGHFGATRLDAADEHVDALGYVVEAGVIGAALVPRMRSLPEVDFICPARLIGLELEDDAAQVRIEQNGAERMLSAGLVVAADGGRSTTRALVGARTFSLGYGQTAVIANLFTDRPHGNIAFERFTDTGPLALLPNGGPVADLPAERRSRRWSLVWTVRDQQVPEVLELTDEIFISRLQDRLGHRAGRIVEAGPRQAYPLGLNYVRDHVRHRLAFIGNAAHTIHPVAGQGFNLGLRDVAALAEVLADAAAAGKDCGAMDTLQAYADWRRADYLKVMGMTDGLARMFSNRFAPIAMARNLGMVMMDLVPPARHLLARQAMGLTGRLPRLARGVPLGGARRRAE